ncbi:DUF1707 SHOCT-like domain-containing protein [Stackebrandtia nassauensis]|uniref:DUF1707 domain-containing protein n=1 Tax=Stackebrandtia nassauensis (strain DSM 44728 / CIP 108903 / NRRL B-16338 / NBRC 102104 / LLR-40K-21) TaxID=446470 RepID=D3QBA3_STANL|nr:DUF1707 domain-containing protein [Stackebrandtia nassauensis]ADD40920.1 protein of unknown function DUF1707 [Stackebrandtia nassauensis DSM 44728]
MNDKDKLRIGDSDRELVSRLLKQAVDEGRLTLPEYDLRLQQVYEAKTVGDLDPITGDLMGSNQGVLAVTESGNLSTVHDAPPRRTRPRRDKTPAWVKWMWFGWLVPVTVCTTIWGIGLVTGGTGYMWPLWVAGTIGAPMACVTFMERFMIRPALIERDQQRLVGE